MNIEQRAQPIQERSRSRSRTKLLYCTADGMVCYGWRRATLHEEGRYTNEVDAAAKLVAQLVGYTVHLLLDITEESFHLETLPLLGRTDREQLLQRRLAQRFGPTRLATVLPLGRTSGPRREEMVLLAGCEPQRLAASWLQALEHAGVAVASVHTPALLAPRLARQLGCEFTSLLLFSVQTRGLRQSYLQDGSLHFSRYTPISGEGGDDELIAALTQETARLCAYLSAATEARSAYEALLILPETAPALQTLSSDSLPSVRLQSMSIAAAARRVGLRHWPADAGAEVLYLHLLASRRPAQQYGDRRLRAVHLRQQRVRMLIGGAAASAMLCAALTVVQLLHIQGLSGQLQQAQTALTAIRAMHTRARLELPALPASLEYLRTTLLWHRQLAARDIDPAPLLRLLSHALDASPEVRLESLDWHVETDPLVAHAAVPAVHENLQITISLPELAASDFRTISLVAGAFAKRLPQHGLLVTEVDPPLALRVDQGITADYRPAGPPRFALTLQRRQVAP